MKELPKNKKYNIIYADPPWAYRDKRNRHKRLCGGARPHYGVMHLDEIKELPVGEIADTNCTLFLWATFPAIKLALEVIDAWGFEYKTLGFSWIKTNKNNGKPCFGIGHYTRSNCEVCLIGVKGKFAKASNSVSSVVLSTRRGHSEKPDCVRDSIVELCGDVPRIELFAMGHHDGWDSVGFDIDGRDIKESLGDACGEGKEE